MGDLVGGGEIAAVWGGIETEGFVDAGVKVLDIGHRTVRVILGLGLTLSSLAAMEAPAVAQSDLIGLTSGGCPPIEAGNPKEYGAIMENTSPSNYQIDIGWELFSVTDQRMAGGSEVFNPGDKGVFAGFSYPDPTHKLYTAPGKFTATVLSARDISSGNIVDGVKGQSESVGICSASAPTTTTALVAKTAVPQSAAPVTEPKPQSRSTATPVSKVVAPAPKVAVEARKTSTAPTAEEPTIPAVASSTSSSSTTLPSLLATKDSAARPVESSRRSMFINGEAANLKTDNRNILSLRQSQLGLIDIAVGAIAFLGSSGVFIAGRRNGKNKSSNTSVPPNSTTGEPYLV